MSEDQFRLHATIFCLVFFLIMTGGHALALYVKGSMEIGALESQLRKDDLAPELREELEGNLENVSHIDFWTILASIGNIMFGLNLPAAFAILISIVNSILILAVIIINWSFIKAHIPFISG